MEQGAKNDCFLVAILPGKDLRPIIVEFLEKEETIKVCIDGYIKDLKKAISDALSIPGGLQRLSIGGELLDNNYLKKQMQDKKVREVKRQLDIEFELISLAEMKIVEGSKLKL